MIALQPLERPLVKGLSTSEVCEVGRIAPLADFGSRRLLVTITLQPLE